MKRLTFYLWPVLLAASFVGLYQMKSMVEEREKDLAQLRRVIADEKETIQILRAEWAYLNQPARLQRLAAAHSDTKPLAGRQLTTIGLWPDRAAAAAAQEAMRGDAAATPGRVKGPR